MTTDPRPHIRRRDGAIARLRVTTTAASRALPGLRSSGRGRGLVVGRSSASAPRTWSGPGTASGNAGRAGRRQRQTRRSVSDGSGSAHPVGHDPAPNRVRPSVGGRSPRAAPVSTLLSRFGPASLRRPAAGRPSIPSSTVGGRTSLASLLASPLGRRLVSGLIGMVSTAVWAVLYTILRRWLGRSRERGGPRRDHDRQHRREPPAHLRDPGPRRLLRDHGAGAAFGFALAITTAPRPCWSAPRASRVVELAVLIVANAVATLGRFVLLRRLGRTRCAHDGLTPHWLTLAPDRIGAARPEGRAAPHSRGFRRWPSVAAAIERCGVVDEAVARRDAGVPVLGVRAVTDGRPLVLDRGQDRRRVVDRVVDAGLGEIAADEQCRHTRAGAEQVMRAVGSEAGR